MSENNPDRIYLKFGRRKTDTKIGIDWHRKRAAIVSNLAYIDDNVIYLEPISTVPQIRNYGESQKGEFKFGVVLIDRNWGNQYYALTCRESWDEDRYFELANQLIKNRNEKK